MRAVFALCLLLSSCVVEVDYTGTSFICGERRCPDDFRCEAERCVPAGLVTDAGVDANPPDAAPPTCPASCALVASTRLCFCPLELLWDEAREECEKTGRVLSRIDTPEVSMAARAVAAAETARIWLGGSDLDAEGDWRWLQGDQFWMGLSDGGPPAGAFADFAPMEPNQFMGNEEDCLQVWDVGWNDARCSETRPFFCSDP